MKSTKKILSILCLVLCTVLIFAACANTGSTTPDPTKTPDSTKAPEATVAPTQEPEAKVHKLRIMGPSSFANFVNWDDRENYASWKLFEEHLKERNIELEYDWIVPEQYTTVIQTRMAGAVDLPDIANISPLDDMTAISLGMNGTILDVNSAIEQYSDGTIEKTYEEGDLVFAKQLTTAPDGKRYWFSNAIASGTIEMPDGS
jgi:ABC-type glycerol-3-phosphate transport system substrate-binding protein